MSRKTFLQEFCESLVEEHGIHGLKDVVVVIPSQRVALYVREELLKLSKETFWMPEVLPVNQFLEDLHDFTVIDELEAVFELYEAYHKVFETPDSFDDFLSWSSMIMSDFNDIDKYLLDADQVFKNLQSIKDIEAWSFNNEELSQTQTKFLKFWEQLGVLYHEFNKRLSERGEMTNARVYRSIAEQPEKYLTRFKKRAYFIGFNALSNAEERILKFFVNSGMGKVLWDADDYYLQNSVMEAGRFMRKYTSWSGTSSEVNTNNLTGIPKVIKLFKANSNLHQTSIASAVLGELGDDPADDTAVVFADESLLKPMLNILPKNIDKLNVAMGYPLNAAAIFSFFEEVIQVQLNIERYRNNGYVYYKDFERIASHELFQTYCREHQVSLSGIQRKISTENYSYLPVELLKSELGKSAQELLFLFEKALDVVRFIEQTLTLIQEMYVMLSNDVLEQESIYALVVALKKVVQAQEKYGRVVHIKTFNLLSRHLLRGLSVSFLGEPLEGVQVLGLLETRALDFKRVILLSCNEEVLPKRSHSNSIMPYDLRRYLGLPTRDDKEAIFAYYFYRLLQRAEEVSLIYNGGEADGMKSNEVSRYLLQVQEELVGENVKVRQLAVASASRSEIAVETESTANEEIRGRILKWFENGISASGINQFGTCPRNFLFSQLLRLSQDEEIEEDIEMSTYGTIVHEVLENLYREAGELITQQEIEVMLKSYKDELKKGFDKRFPSGNYLNGKNLLLFETAIHTVRKYLESERILVKERGAIKIIGLEERYEKVVPLQTLVGEIALKIKGHIDRVDQIGDVVRVIDYKTGKVERLDFKGDWSKLRKHELQLMVYLYLFDSDQEVASGMISFKELSKGFQQFSFAKRDAFDPAWVKGEFKEQFEEFLLQFVENVLSSTFEHSPTSRYCKLC